MMTSWIPISAQSDFSLENLPLGTFRPLQGGKPRLGVPLGDVVIDLENLAQQGLLKSITQNNAVFSHSVLNPFMELGQGAFVNLRKELQRLFKAENTDHTFANSAIFKGNEVENLLPIHIGDYVDFYASKEHASNMGRMFRDEKNPLLPNWVHIPVGYHGRASSICVSGSPVTRPWGQIRTKEQDTPIFAPSREMDFELEIAFISGINSQKPLSPTEAAQAIFGFTLFNDWTARDIQRWEYVPLGPFLGKSFAGSLSPWIVCPAALESFRTTGPAPDMEPLPYLRSQTPDHYNITLEVWLKPAGNRVAELISKTNMRHLYWSPFQQLAHLTSNGSPLRVGDMCATGTISGSTPDSFGSILELSWNGTKPLKLAHGVERSFLLDGDEVIMKGYGEGNGFRVGLGEVRGVVGAAQERPR